MFRHRRGGCGGGRRRRCRLTRMFRFAAVFCVCLFFVCFLAIFRFLIYSGRVMWPLPPPHPTPPLLFLSLHFLFCFVVDWLASLVLSWFKTHWQREGGREREREGQKRAGERIESMQGDRKITEKQIHIPPHLRTHTQPRANHRQHKQQTPMDSRGGMWAFRV